MRTIFLNDLEKEYSEYIETGEVQILKDVERQTSKRFLYQNPIYFSGNINSKLAVITFNSTRNKFSAVECNESFSDYQYKCQNFGKLFVNEESLDLLTTNDIRTMAFISPFQVIRFDGKSIQENLQKLIDEKFELDLIPYASPDFSPSDFIQNYSTCKTLVDRTLNGIYSHPRQYVIFFGEYFTNILREYIVDSERFTFLLTSNLKPNQKNIASFTRITLKYNNIKIIAGIAESFYDENLDEVMLEKYGRESAAIINRGFLLTTPLWKTH